MDTLREAAKKESDPDGNYALFRVKCYSLTECRRCCTFSATRTKSAFIVAVAELLRIRDALLNDEADVGVFYRVGKMMP